VELGKWEQTLHGQPWRMTEGVEPYEVKASRTVLNGGREETCRKVTRLAPTHLLQWVVRHPCWPNGGGVLPVE
jgi:hypothetical protein